MKIKSIKGLVLTLLFSSFLFSCKKDSTEDTTPAYYVKFKMDGSWVTWTKVLGELGPDLGDNSKVDFGLTANNENLSEVLDIALQLDGTTIPTGTYNTDDHFMPMTYIKNANTSNMQSYSPGYVNDQTISRYELTLTSITDKTIKGTFKGNYMVNDDFSGTLLHITEGEFVIPRIR